MEKSKTNIPSKVNFAFKQSLTALAKKKKKKERGTCHLRKFGYVANQLQLNHSPPLDTRKINLLSPYRPGGGGTAL